MADKKTSSLEDPTVAPTETPEVTAITNEMFQVGDAGNRPADPVVNTIYYSINTGTRERYLGDGNWELIDNLHK